MRRLVAAGVLVGLAGLAGKAAAQGRTGEMTQAMQTMARCGRAYAANDFSKAEEECLKAFSYDPTLVDAIDKLAAIYYEKGRYRQAVALLRRASAANPGNPRVESWLGLHLLKLRRKAEGISHLKKAVKKNHKLFLAQLKLGAYYFKKRKYRSAVTAFWNFLKFRPKAAAKVDPVVHRLLGVSYLRLGKYPQAQTRLLRALALRPKDKRAELELGEVYARRGFCNPALSIFRKYRRLRAKRPKLYYLEAVCHFRLKAKSRAVAAVTKFIAVRPKVVDGYLLLGDIHLYYREYSQALRAYQRAVQMVPGSVDAAVKYARALMGLKMYRKAKVVLERTQRSAADDPALLAVLGRCYEALKQYDKAIVVARKLVAKQPKDVDAWTLLGWVSLKKNDVSDAVAAFRKANRLSGGRNSEARGGLVAAINSQAYGPVMKGDWNKARSLLDEAYRLDPKRLMTLRNLGLVNLASRQYQASEKYLRRAFRKVPRDLVVNRLLGRVYLATRRLEAARTHYIRARQAAYRVGGVVLAEVQIEFAAVLAKLGRMDESISQLKDAVLNSGSDSNTNKIARQNLVRLLLIRASKLIRDGKGDKALDDCGLAVKHAKGLPDQAMLKAKFMLAMASLDAAKWGAAVSLLKELGTRGSFAKVLKPPYDKLGLKFFEVYAAYRQGRYGYAAAQFRRMSRRVKGPLRAKIEAMIVSCREFDAATALRLGKVKAALALLKAVGRRTRESRHNLALAYYRGGSVSRAIRMWKSAGMPPSALCNLGVHYDNMGQPEQAYRYYKQCLARGGGNAAIRRRAEVKRKLFGFK